MNKVKRKEMNLMVSLDKLRITKLKCLSCGCRDKRITILESKTTRKKIGFATICCNCGHIKTYMFRKNRKCKMLQGEVISDFDTIEHLNGKSEVSQIFCAIPHPYCINTSCPLYQSRVKKDMSFLDIEEGRYESAGIKRIPEGEIQKSPEKGKFI